MSPLRTSSARRWAVPVAVTALVAGAAGATALPAGAVDLPDISPEDVLVLAQGADVDSLSGEVLLQSDLGLPELPGQGGDAADPTALLAGETRMRVWVDGEQRQRLQVLRGWSQLDVVHDGRTVWTYDSDEDAYAKGRLPAYDERERRAHQQPAQALTPQALTPQELAERALAAVEPSTEVTVGEDLEVAGREAYELRLAPRTDATLVGQVAVAVDAETGMALRVSVTARGAAEPSLQVGYTGLDLDRPSADRFRLDPPAGAEVRALEGFDGRDRDGRGRDAREDRSAERRADRERDAGTEVPGVEVSGSDWASVVEVDAPAVQRALDGLDPSQVDALTSRVDGGRALSSDLLSVLLTDDGRLLAGAVPVEALAEAAR